MGGAQKTRRRRFEILCETQLRRMVQLLSHDNRIWNGAETMCDHHSSLSDESQPVEFAHRTRYKQRNITVQKITEQRRDAIAVITIPTFFF